MWFDVIRCLDLSDPSCTSGLAVFLTDVCLLGSLAQRRRILSTLTDRNSGSRNQGMMLFWVKTAFKSSGHLTKDAPVHLLTCFNMFPPSSTKESLSQEFAVTTSAALVPVDQLLHVGLAMSVISLHHQNQIPIGFQGPSQLHLTELALSDALREEDQHISWIWHAVAHALHSWILGQAIAAEVTATNQAAYNGLAFLSSVKTIFISKLWSHQILPAFPSRISQPHSLPAQCLTKRRRPESAQTRPDADSARHLGHWTACDLRRWGKHQAVRYHYCDTIYSKFIQLIVY